jgi:hypothetical protein
MSISSGHFINFWIECAEDQETEVNGETNLDNDIQECADVGENGSSVFDHCNEQEYGVGEIHSG